jgi:hypothetical protein
MASAAVNSIRQLGGELVTYTPFGGVAKTFRAIVERDRPSHQTQQTNGRVFGVNSRTVWIARDADDGMLSIQERKDKVRFKKDLSDATETDFTVTTILKEDVGLAGDSGAFYVQVEA